MGRLSPKEERQLVLQSAIQERHGEGALADGVYGVDVDLILPACSTRAQSKGGL